MVATQVEARGITDPLVDPLVLEAMLRCQAAQEMVS